MPVKDALQDEMYTADWPCYSSILSTDNQHISVW